MLLLPRSLLLLLGAFVASTVGQHDNINNYQLLAERDDASDLSALAAELPSCGLNCIVAAFSATNSSCATAECMCSDEALLEWTTVCVTQNCTVTNQLLTKNVTNTACGAPVRDAGIDYNVLSITLGCISAVVLLLRLGFKMLVAKVPLAWDDCMITLTVLTGIPGTVLTSLGTIANGLGRDVWTLTPTQITAFVYYFYYMQWLYFMSLGFLKLSLLFFYLKIFPTKSTRLVLWATIGFTVIWTLAFCLVAVFNCNPISYYWTNWDGEHTGTCLDTNAIGWANAATSIAEDVWMLAIPLWQLRGLQLHFKKKIGVAIMFCTGTFVTVISVIRLESLISFAKSDNPTWDNLKVSQWSTIEVNVGIICACMPALRLILLRMFPILSSTTRKYGTNGSFVGDKYSPASRRNQSSVYGAGAGAGYGYGYGGGGAGAGSRALASVGEGGGRGGGRAGDAPGITYERSYAVHYHDIDTSSQVQLKDLDAKGFEVASNISECSA